MINPTVSRITINLRTHHRTRVSPAFRKHIHVELTLADVISEAI